MYEEDPSGDDPGAFNPRLLDYLMPSEYLTMHNPLKNSDLA